MSWSGSVFRKSRKWWMKRKLPGSSKFTTSPTPFRVSDPDGEVQARALLRRCREEWAAVEVIKEPPKPKRYVDPTGPARRTFKRRRGSELACESCGWRPKPPLGSRAVNAHHIVPTAAGGSNDHDNLAALCPNCHAMAHAIYGRGAAPGRAELLATIREAVA